MVGLAFCEKHPEEELRPCLACKKPVCGVCDTYINILTEDAITKEVWEGYKICVKVTDYEWPEHPSVAHMDCARTRKWLVL